MSKTRTPCRLNNWPSQPLFGPMGPLYHYFYVCTFPLTVAVVVVVVAANSIILPLLRTQHMKAPTLQTRAAARRKWVEWGPLFVLVVNRCHLLLLVKADNVAQPLMILSSLPILQSVQPTEDLYTNTVALAKLDHITRVLEAAAAGPKAPSSCCTHTK